MDSSNMKKIYKIPFVKGGDAGLAFRLSPDGVHIGFYRPVTESRPKRRS